jgi:hypothetical protein
VTAADDPVAVLVIRSWTEQGMFRARIIVTTDVSHHHQQTTMAATPHQVAAAVHAWLAHVTEQTNGRSISKIDRSGDVPVTVGCQAL